LATALPKTAPSSEVCGAGLNFFVSTSFSKSFSLYGERVGALSVLVPDKEEPTAC
jgi:aspartate/tyrosine/aromatic aminotransferase